MHFLKRNTHISNLFKNSNIFKLPDKVFLIGLLLEQLRIHDDSDSWNIVEEFVELTKSITKDCNSDVIASGIVGRYSKLNEKVRSVNRLLRIYCRNLDIRFVGRENINPSKHLNRSALHLNHLGTPVLTVNFLDVLNSLDSEQWLEWKGSSNSDKNSSKSEALNEVTFLSRKFTKNIFFGYLNINYVKNKLEALEFPTKDKFGVFLVSESNLDSSFPETQFRIPIYRIFRQVRNKYGGGDFPVYILYRNIHVRDKSRKIKTVNF